MACQEKKKKSHVKFVNLLERDREREREKTKHEGDSLEENKTQRTEENSPDYLVLKKNFKIMPSINNSKTKC